MCGILVLLHSMVLSPVSNILQGASDNVDTLLPCGVAMCCVADKVIIVDITIIGMAD